jgi:ribose transport system substrate-binding protein
MSRFLKYLALALCLFAGGCGGPDADYVIIVIPKGLTHEHWQSVHRGADRCAADLAEEGVRVQVIFDGPLRERDAMEQIRIVDRRVATRLPARTGIVLAPQHSKTMTACVKRADEAGVPVVVIDSDLVEKNHYVKYVATDNEHGGYLAGKHLIEQLRRQGKTQPRLILFRYAVGSESTEQREKGFERAVAEFCPGAVWLSTDKYAGATRDSAKREAGPLILQFKEQVDGIFAPNESSASGMLDVLKSQGLNRKVLLMGFDSSKPLLDAIREGDVIGSVLQDPYRMGYVSTWECVRFLRGENVNASGTQMSLSTGEYLVTRENVDSEFVHGLYDPETQSRRTTQSLRQSAEGKP